MAKYVTDKDNCGQYHTQKHHLCIYVGMAEPN